MKSGQTYRVEPSHKSIQVAVVDTFDELYAVLPRRVGCMHDAGISGRVGRPWCAVHRGRLCIAGVILLVRNDGHVFLLAFRRLGS